MRIAVQGEVGSFHYQAVDKWFQDKVRVLSAQTFGEVFGMLNRFEADMAVVAVENSLYGSINEVLDLIDTHHYAIVGEVYLRIEQQLIALADTTPSMVEKVYSHPVALAQCEQYLDTHFPNAQRIEYYDTAASVRYIKQLGDPATVAIAGRSAADIYHLPILAKNIEDDKANFTRFLVLARAKQAPDQTWNKVSLIVTTDNTRGALAKVLNEFARNGADLTKLQSRPIIGQPWRYRFYLDAKIDSNRFKQMLASIRKDGSVTITVLGTYIAALP